MLSDDGRRLSTIQNISHVIDAIYSLGDRSGITLGGVAVMSSISLGTFTKKYWTVTTLAEKYGLPSSTVSDYVARFIAMGTVCEITNLDDRRKKYLKMTPLGISNADNLAELLERPNYHI